MEQARPTESETQERLREAIRQTAPGTSLRHALDMMIAGGLGALICIGDTDAVLAAGNDGFPLNISFTANRLFELAKMDGAIVVDEGMNQIIRTNFHLNPDPSLPTSETGMRHRTAARMSQLTRALVISVSERRKVVSIYINGRSFQLKSTVELMASVNQLLVSLQTTRQELDRSLWKLTTLEVKDYATLSDVTHVIYLFEVLLTASDELDAHVAQLGSEGRTVAMRREELVGDMEDEYMLLIRDYAKESSYPEAERIRTEFHKMANTMLRSPSRVAAILGYPDLREDSVMVPQGLRTLSSMSVVREGMADRIVDEYGSLRQLVADITEHPERIEALGVNNATILADSLTRLRKRNEQ